MCVCMYAVCVCVRESERDMTYKEIDLLEDC